MYIGNSKLGQFWTPSHVADVMVRNIFQDGSNIKNILDPACGPATFSSALSRYGIKNIKLYSYDVDNKFSNFTKSKNMELGIDGETYTLDYLLDDRYENYYDAVIMNPPYIRHEQIPEKDKDAYHKFLFSKFDEKIDRRANMFALFLLKGIINLKPNGIMCAIVYDAITQTLYGKHILSILQRYANVINVEHVKTPFSDVLIDAQILTFKKRLNPLPNLGKQKQIINLPENFEFLGKLMNTRRGTCLPFRKPFIAASTDPYFKLATPILVKQNNLEMIAMPSDKWYLVTSNKERSHDFQDWLINRVKAENRDIKRMEYKPIHGEIVFNYYLRNSPRHLWNPNSIPASDNFYVSTVNHDFPKTVAWLLLNSDLYVNYLSGSGRQQGNGLIKLQLFEYENTIVPDWRKLPKRILNNLDFHAQKLIGQKANYQQVRLTANKLVEGVSREYPGFSASN